MKGSQKDLEELYKRLNKDSSIKDLQEYIRKMIIARGFDNSNPRDVMLLLTEELGEVAKEVRKQTSNLKIDANKKNNENNLDKEIADVFIELLSLCVVTDIDLFDAFMKKEEINLKREWK